VLKTNNNRSALLVCLIIGFLCINVQAQDSPFFELEPKLSDKPPSFLDQLTPSPSKPTSNISGMNNIPIRKFRIQGNAIFSGYDDDMCAILAMYCISDKVLDQLKEEGLPADVTNQLSLLLNHFFIDEDQFILSIKRLLAENDVISYLDIIIPKASIYPDHVITPESLHAVKRLLTKYYQKRGYINSIAVIPDQEVINNEIIIKVIEGKLTRISVFGNKNISTQYIIDRLQPAVKKKNKILNIYELEKALQQCIPLLKLDPQIKNIHVHLKPGISMGEANLEIQIIEEKMINVKIGANNHHSPAIGSYCGEISFGHLNLLGFGDSVNFQYGVTEGLDDIAFSYNFPLGERGGGLKISADRSKSVVIAENYRHFDLTNTVSSFSFGIIWPFLRTLSREFSMTLQIERLHSKTTFMDMPFPLDGADRDGNADLSIFHCIHEWLYRTNQNVFGLRSIASFGIDAFNATINENGPDGRFSTWMIQTQWLRHLNFLDSQLLTRLDFRFSNQHLMPSQKFAIGGVNSVRGYRENRITSDDGQLASIEWQLPMGRLPLFTFSPKQEDGQLRGSCFIDYGNAHNVDSKDPSIKSISSIGLGLHWNINKRIFSKFYWAHALRDLETPEQYDIQDDGIHFLFQTVLY